MTEHYLARVTLPHINGLARDQFVNDVSIGTPAVLSGSDALALINDLLTAYTTVSPISGSSHPLGYYLSSEVSRASNAMRAQLYHRAAAAPFTLGSPVSTTFATVPNAGGTAGDLPAEVALVLSMHADLTDVPQQESALSDTPTPRAAIRMGAPVTHQAHGRPAARRRGRLYMGPLRGVAGNNGADGVYRPIDMVKTDFLNSWKTFANTITPGIGHVEVFSKRNGNGVNIVGLSLDDAFDTQRRRGPKATAKVSTTVN